MQQTNQDQSQPFCMQSQTSQNIYYCLICKQQPYKPVVTQCGHLFCWNCLNQTIQDTNKCPICRLNCNPALCYPIFIEEIQENTDKPVLPGRPAPIYKDKILNTNMISSAASIGGNNLSSNIYKEKLVTGYALMPSLGVMSMNIIGDAQQGDDDYIISKNMKILTSLLLIFILIVSVSYLILG